MARRSSLSSRSDPAPSSSFLPGSHLDRFQEKVASQQKELQTLLIDHQRLSATHVALNQELVHSKKEISQLKLVSAKVKAERDDQVRQVYERSLKFDAEARAVEAMREDLGRVAADVVKLNVKKEALVAELKRIQDEVLEARLKTKKLPEVHVALEIMRQEVQRGRNAIEFEKNTRVTNQEHRKLMEKNMIKVGREIECLRVALANAEKQSVEQRAGFAAKKPEAEHAANNGHPETRYDGGAYPHSHSMHQPTGTAEVALAPLYTSATAGQDPYAIQHNAHVYGPYNTQQPTVHR